jgi:hypothetical protein
MNDSKGLQYTFKALAILFALGGFFFLQGLNEASAPWLHTLPDEHLWHGAVHGALVGCLFGGSLIAILWRSSDKALLLNFYIIGHAIFILVFVASSWELFKMKFFVAIMFTMVCSLLYGFFANRREIFRPTKPTRYDRSLLILTFLCALALLPIGWEAWVKQLGETGEFFRWGENPALFLTLLYGGYLAATGRPGSKAMAIVLGITYLFLGAAALTVPHHPGSFGLLGGGLCLLSGLLYIGITIKNNRFTSTTPIPMQR